jgi:hypothetical protein
VQFNLAFLAILLAVTLASVVPSNCGCGLDLHKGEALHPVFAHVHAETPTEADELTAPAPGQTQMRLALALEPAGGSAIAGIVLPRLLLPPEMARHGDRLWNSASSIPLSLSRAPIDPPPRSA